MLNLFMIFDPMMSYFSMNWVSLGLFVLFFPQKYWFFSSRLIFIYVKVLDLLWLEFSILSVNRFNKSNLLVFIALWLYVFYGNFLGLFPYVFTGTSHLVMSLSFSLPVWFSFMLFGWLKNSQFMFCHLVPLGTPTLLMFFMVLIETLSNIIRPITLAVRLAANMIAGHLLLTLLSMFIPNLFIYMFIFVAQVLLLLLEGSVSLIQAYVFVVLLVLYMKETN
uniref:ATP synthase subunit a n=1 Tax=Elasmosoma sp. QL-2014 TaxID=1491720 RepID=A0A0U1WYG7_9HYME|nr:ATP synthase F0 subunit 6 [Elasmosoma sp. QL-2014]